MTYSTETTLPGPAQASAESKNWATLSHLSAFVVFLGIPSLIGPLVAWLVKRDDPYVEHHAKEALNFNISFLRLCRCGRDLDPGAGRRGVATDRGGHLVRSRDQGFRESLSR